MDKQTRDIENLMDRIKKMHESGNWSKQVEEEAKPTSPEVISAKPKEQAAHVETSKKNVEKLTEKKGPPHFDSKRINAEKETLMVRIYKDIEAVEKAILETQEDVCVALEKLEGVINKMMERETDIVMINNEADGLEANLNKEMEDLKNAKAELQKILGK